MNRNRFAAWLELIFPISAYLALTGRAEGGLSFVAMMIAFARLSWKPAMQSICGLGTVVLLLHALVDYPMQQRPALAAWFLPSAGQRWPARREPSRMMDYYEELGLCRTASVDEVRQAYRHLVRLLHPDRCTDESARALAEIQTKRLNGILAVLSRQPSREQYDRSLEAAPRQRGVPWQRATGRPPDWFWPALGALVLINLVFLFFPERTHSIPARPANESPVAAARPAAPPKSRTRGRPSRSRPGEAIFNEELRLPEVPALPPVTASVPIEPETANVHEAGPGPVRPPPPAAEPPPRFSGNWLLTSGIPRDTRGLYPPEYIELHVTEESGSLHGRYRARYRVTDQAISPAVAFEFEGPSRGTEAVLPWRGPGGASGEVILQLRGADTLEVQWMADRIGVELGLVSGKATLTRRLE